MKTQRAFEAAFEEIRTSLYFKKILGFILSLGNILNGGTPRGQADGFYLEALSKMTTTKDLNNRTILQLICERMKAEEGEEFSLNFKAGFKNLYYAVQYSLKEEDTKVKDLRSEYDKARGNYDQIEKMLAGASMDNYCLKAKEFLGEAGLIVGEIEGKLTQIQKTFVE